MIHTLTTLVGGIELLTEITAVGVLLMVLDRLATAIRWTYNAGRFVGRVWFSYGLPVLLWTADQTSRLLSQIDWRFVAATTWDCLKTITALVITAALIIRDWHRDWVGSIDWTVSAPSAPPVAPSINPLFDVATELDQFSCKQIRQAFGLRQKVSKTKLIAAAIAC